MDQALKAMRRSDGGGVGVLVSEGAAGVVGIDADYVEGGERHSLGQEVVERFKGAYVETSPSGTGFRVFCRGAIPAGTPKGSTAIGQQHQGMEIKFEAYASGGEGRFLRVTGLPVEGTGGVVGDCQSGVDWFCGVMTG